MSASANGSEIVIHAMRFVVEQFPPRRKLGFVGIGASGEGGGDVGRRHAMRADDIERYRGRWIPFDQADDDRVIADAASLEALHEALATFEHPRVLVHRVPTVDEPLFVGLG